MMRLSLVVLALLVFGGGCSKILSQRTDEQAWLEFDHEIKNSRKPASIHEDQTHLDLHEELALIPVRKILLRCGSLVSPEVCYQSELTLKFDEVFHRIQSKHADLKNAEYRKEQKDFLALRTFENTSAEVARFHQSILSGVDLKARERAEALFRFCDGEKNANVNIENFNVFTTLKSEMPKAVYSCLSQKWTLDEDQLLDETSERLGLQIVTPEARGWIKAHQLSPIYESEMNSLLEKKQKEELEEFTAEKEQILKGFNANLSTEALLTEWSNQLRNRFPYSPVEQWVMKEKKK